MAATASLAAIREQLPLPLARLADRYEQCRGLQRVYAALYVWEASLKLLASTALIEFAALRDPRQDLEGLLYRLARPSDGDLWRILRELTGVLSQAGHKEFQRVEQFLLTTAHRDMPRAAGLESTLKDVLSPGEKHSQATVTLRTLYDRLVQFRNTIAHKSFAMLPTERHDEIAKVLAEGMADILRRHDVLAGCQLIWVQDVKQSPTSGDWQVDRWALTGVEPKQLEALEFPRSESEQLPRTQWLYLHPAGVDLADPRGLAPDRLLHPLLYYDHNVGDVCFLNADVDKRKKKRIADLYCYSVGEQQRKDLLDDLRQLLQRLLAKPVTRQQIVERAAATLDEDTIVNGGEEPTGPDEDPKWLGEFELLNVIGHGAMGVVYRAWQPMMGREVALKRLKGGGEDTRARFRNEISALGRVRHPNVVKIYQYGAAGIDEFYTMELLPGADLGRVLRHLCTNAESQIHHGQDTIGIDASTWDRAMSTAVEEARGEEKPLSSREGSSSGPKSPAVALEALNLPAQAPAHFHGSQAYLKRIADIGRQIAAGLHALHEMEVVHRDVKPSNIMITPDGLAVLTDLGLARIQMEESQNLTTEHFLGTVRYASPEQAMSPKQVDRRTDVYSLGVTLWELLTFRSFKDITPNTPFPQAAARLLEEAEPVRKYARHVPRDLEAVVMKCLDRDRAKRYDTAKELAEHLSLWLSGEPVPIAPPSMGAQTRRWLWKHRWAAGLTGLVATSLLLAAGFLTMVFVHRKVTTLNEKLEDEFARTEALNSELGAVNKKLEAETFKLEEEQRRAATFSMLFAKERARADDHAGDWLGALMWYAHAMQSGVTDDVKQQLREKISASLQLYPVPVNAWTTSRAVRQLGVVEEAGGPVVVAFDGARRSYRGNLFGGLSPLETAPGENALACLSPSARAAIVIRGGEMERWAAPFTQSTTSSIPSSFRVEGAALSDAGHVVVSGLHVVGNRKTPMVLIGDPADSSLSMLVLASDLAGELRPPRIDASQSPMISPDGSYLLGAGSRRVPLSVWRIESPVPLPEPATPAEPGPAPAVLSEAGVEADLDFTRRAAMLTPERLVPAEGVGRKRADYPKAKQVVVSLQNNMIATAGEYTSLWVREATEGDEVAEAPPGGATSTIQMGTDADFWQFQSPFDGELVVEMQELVDGESRLDCIVAVLNDQFEVQVENDDDDRDENGGSPARDAGDNRRLTRDSFLSYHIEAGTTYYVRASSLGKSAGRYRLLPRARPDDAAESDPYQEMSITRPAVWHEIRRETTRPSTHAVFDRAGRRLLVCRDGERPVLWHTRSHGADVTLNHVNAQLGVFNHDGRWVATFAPNGVRVWDSATGAPLTPLLSAGRTPGLLAFDPSGRWLVVGSEFEVSKASPDAASSLESADLHYELTAWDLRCGEEGFEHRSLSPHAQALLPNPTGDAFLVTELDGVMSVVDGEGRPVRQDLPVDQRRIGAALLEAVSAATSSGLSLERTFRTEGSSLLARWRRDRPLGAGVEELRSLATFSPDGRRLALKHADHLVTVCDLADAGAGRLLEFDGQTVDHLVWSPDGNRLAVVLVGRPAVVHVWDRVARTEKEIPTPSRVLDASFSADGTWIAIAGESGVDVWTLEGPKPLRVREISLPNRAPALAVRLSRDFTKLLVVQGASDPGQAPLTGARVDYAQRVADVGCEIRLRDLASGRSQLLARGAGTIDGMTFTLDGADRIVTWTGNIATCWDFDGEPVQRFAHGNSVEQIVAYDDGARLVSWSPQGLLRVWDTRTGEETQLPVAAPGTVHYAGVARNGDLWAVYNLSRLARWRRPENRLPDDDRQVSLMIERLVGRRVDEKTIPRAIDLLPNIGPMTAPGPQEYMAWRRRQFADCIAAEDWDAAAHVWEGMPSLFEATGQAEGSIDDRILKALTLLAHGTTDDVHEALEICANMNVPSKDQNSRRLRLVRGLARLRSGRIDRALVEFDPNEYPEIAAYQTTILSSLLLLSDDCRLIVAELLVPEAASRTIWAGNMRSIDDGTKECVTRALCTLASSIDLPLHLRHRALAMMPADLPLSEETFDALADMLMDPEKSLGDHIPTALRRQVALAAPQAEDLSSEELGKLLQRLAEDQDSRVSDAAHEAQERELQAPSVEQPRAGQ